MSLKLTAREVITLTDEAVAIAKDPVIIKRDKLQIEDKVDEEYDLLSSNKTCDVDIDKLHKELAGIDAKKFKEALSSNLYNPAAMKAGSCVMSSIIYTNPDEPDVERLKYWLGNLERVGAESAIGIAMRSPFGEANDVFVLKSGRTDTSDILHETFLATMGTNRLREEIPNFVYAYGGFRCGRPVVNPETKEVTYWCRDNTKPTDYIVYEDINPSVTFYEFVKKCTKEEFLEAYMQILFALRRANHLIDFTHYDLHSQNVLIRRLPSLPAKFSIKYGNEYVNTSFVSTIIDFDASHIKYQGKSYGVSGRKYSILPDTSFPLYDAYRLLFSSFKYGNKSVQGEITKIFRYFTSENPEDYYYTLLNEGSEYEVLPSTGEYKDYTLDNLIAFTKRVCDCRFITSKPEGKVLSCKEDMCISTANVLNQIGVRPGAKPKTFFEFYDMKAKKGDFDYNKALKMEVNYLQKELEVLDYTYQNLTPVNLMYRRVNQIFNKKTLREYKIYYSEVYKMLDILENLSFHLEVIEYVGNQYGDLTLYRDLSKQINDRTHRYLDEHVEVIDENFDYIESLIKRGIADRYLIDEEYKWYYSIESRIE